MLTDPEYSSFCDDLLEKAMIKIMNDDASISIDHESYEEVRSIAMELETEVFDPED